MFSDQKYSGDCMLTRYRNSYWLSYDFKYSQNYTCLNGNAVSMSVGVLSIVSDLYAVILPYVILRNYELHMNRRQRIGLNIIFSLGLMVAGAGIARTYYLWMIGNSYAGHTCATIKFHC
jgi:hypothetical protein